MPDESAEWDNDRQEYYRTNAKGQRETLYLINSQDMDTPPYVVIWWPDGTPYEELGCFIPIRQILKECL